ncbi:YbaB/EbfC family nucleoid-associated protein [Streptosporangium sp. NPDC048047]|uniref:YbaB/EbfC family nucleoid-associated protein n=1 Tax=Streptosporangium sp. NPDC048047 TaxID=3155748 RepID=UPI003443C5D0
MPPMPEPGDELRYLDETLHHALQAMRTLEESEERIRGLVEEGEAADGLVRATSDGQGGILTLHLDPRALRLGHAALGREVAAALRQAQQAAGRRSQEILGEVRALAASMPEPLDETFIRDRVEQVARELF